MMYDDAGWGWWWMGALAVFVLLVGLAGAAVVAFAVRAGSGRAASAPAQWSPQGAGRAAQPSPAAMEELDLRLARGEIDEDTYRRTRDLLSHPPGG